MHVMNTSNEGEERLYQKAQDGQDASSGTNGSSAKEVNWPI
jgi:hypothetical protein